MNGKGSEHLHSSCAGKVRHATPQSARSHALDLIKKTRNKAIDYYKCNACGGYHVGKKDKTMIRAAMHHATKKKRRKFAKLLNVGE